MIVPIGNIATLLAAPPIEFLRGACCTRLVHRKVANYIANTVNVR